MEDDYMGDAGLSPKPDRRPDSGPNVREDVPQLGNLVQDFSFSQSPRPPVLLPTNPPTDSPSVPAYFIGRPACLGCAAPPPGERRPAAGLPRRPVSAWRRRAPGVTG